MIEYKYVLFIPVMRRFIYITVKNAKKEKKVVRPNMAKPVNEVTTAYFPKK
jgi:hypothetical protein